MSRAHYALVGEPIDQSPSPAMHNAAFVHLGIDADYSLRPTSKAQAHEVVAELKEGRWRGINVTTPLKTVLASSVELVGNAKRARAVNTLWCQDGAPVAELTDVDGVEEPLLQAGVHRGGEALLLGAGGAARAAALALERLQMRVHIGARRPAAATQLLAELALARPGEALDLRERADLNAALARADVVVQATPVGRRGEAFALDWQLAPSHLLAFEMLYWPRETPFLRSARTAGLATIEGWRMLLAQGARSFTLWTGKEAPRQVMQQALLTHVAQRR